MTKVALVTGASYGVGAATALALVRDGFAVALTATRVQNLEPVVAKIKAAGGRVDAIELDLRSQASIEAAVAGAVKALGAIDVLVNNAG
ncbi:MAG: SDR family NAD(P)-dependent oxidoreductase, partial [Candidatus Binataceae bacterium]